MTDAVAFLERAETDDVFAADLESVQDDPSEVLARVHAAGYDTTPDEILTAVTERYGVELTVEQLEQIAAGADSLGLILGLGLFAVAVAAAAA